MIATGWAELSIRLRQRTMISSALGMVGGKAAAMFLGFAFWLAAANLAAPKAVGLAAGATSTIMLVVLIASSGISAAVVVAKASTERAGVPALVDSALGAAGLLATVVGGIALLLAFRFLDELDAVARDPIFAGLFLAMGILGAWGVVMDQISMADRRGNDVLLRNVANGSMTILPLALVWGGWVNGSATVLFAAWVGGSTTAVVLAVRTCRNVHPGSLTWPRLHMASLRRLAGPGIGNQLLTSAERVPGLILPIIVTETLSPAQNAFWYSTWMMAWGVAVVPLSIGSALFAEICRQRQNRRDPIRRALRSSFLLVVPLSLVVILIAPLLLSLLGTEYSTEGATPLRLLVLGALPLTLTYCYFAVARATGHIGEAIALAGVGGTIGVLAATVAGQGLLPGPSGLTGMAGAWLLTQTASGLVGGWRLRALAEEEDPLATGPDGGLGADGRPLSDAQTAYPREPSSPVAAK